MGAVRATGRGLLLGSRASRAWRRGAALLDGHLRLCESGDATGLTDAAERVLDLVGGPLREGYRRAWEGVIESLAGD
ncbi:MAG TPA: hypothetical protein VFH77_12020 [Streptomyces sp.]|nr:hypothetical protein [Streptomyces sp.]